MSDSEAMVQFQPRSGDTWRDPFTMYKALRDDSPVQEVHGPEGDYWVLSRFEDVFNAVIDAQTFSSAKGLTMGEGEMEKLGLEAPIVMMDPPEHTLLRKLVKKRFTPARVAALEPMIRDFVVERVEHLREMGEGDVIEEFLKPLPSMIVGHFLGVQEKDRFRFDQWTDSIVAANAEGDVLSAPQAVSEMFGFFSEAIERARKEPGDDMISTLVHSELEGKEVPLMKILGLAFTMVAGGNDTTTGLLGGSAELLTKNPEQRKLLLEDPSLIPNAVEEFLRLTSPVQGLARTTTRDVEIHGETIPEGKKVMLLYASGNRDEREFGPDAAECDVTRKIRRHLALGYGAHHCIGAATVRLVARVALEELLARCPEFSVDADQGRYAPGNFVRRYESLPFVAQAGL